MSKELELADALECVAKYRETGGNILSRSVDTLRRQHAEIELLKATASSNYGRGHVDAHSMASARVEELEAEVEALKADRDSWMQQASDRVAKPIPDAVEWYGGVKTDEEIDQQVAHKPLFVEMIAEHPGLREEIEQQDAQQEPAQDEPVVWLNKTAEDKRRCYASTNEHQYLHEAAVLEHAAREISNLFTRPQASNPLKNETELRNSYFIARQAPNTGAVTVRGSAFIELYEAARNIKDKP
jgi:hypothetical protein